MIGLIFGVGLTFGETWNIKQLQAVEFGWMGEHLCAAIMVTVVMCHVHNPACTARYHPWALHKW